MRIYRAFLEQDGTTNNPTVTVFENTLCGVPTMVRTSLGEYEVALTGAFPAGAVWTMAHLQPCEYTTETCCAFQRNNNDGVTLTVFEPDGITRVDGCKVYLEIRVY
jgi:hypothetical protein